MNKILETEDYIDNKKVDVSIYLDDEGNLYEIQVEVNK